MNVSLQSIPVSAPVSAADVAGRSAASGFGDAIASAISGVETAQSLAESATTDLLVGGRGDVHTVALAAQSAELSLELFQQVRNKFVSAYQEIMKMPM